LERFAIVSEDISRPVDEGFKKATARLAAALGKLVPETRVFTRGPEQAEIRAVPLPDNKLLWGAAFSGDLKSFDPDVILYIPEAAATPMSLVRTWSLRRQSGGKPVALMSLQRRPYPAGVRPFLRPFRPDLGLVLSAGAVADLGSIGCRARRVRLGVDSEVFKPPGPGAKEKLRAAYGLPAGKIVLHVGHIAPGRNLELLKDIAGDAVKVLVVTSTATGRNPEVEAMLRESWVIAIDSYVEHIEEIYKAVDGYVFPTFSLTDAIDIPLSVLEAMATNLPVVTTDFGGLADLFASGDGLFICSTEDEVVEAGKRMLEVGTSATRDKVLGLTWKHAAESVLEAIDAEVR
jgi:glycosyltransferase involved in cell wall biosynthesis